MNLINKIENSVNSIFDRTSLEFIIIEIGVLDKRVHTPVNGQQLVLCYIAVVVQIIQRKSPLQFVFQFAIGNDCQSLKRR